MDQTHKGYLPRLHESREEALNRVMGHPAPEDLEPDASPESSNTKRKAIRAGAAVLTAVAAIGVTESPETAKVIKSAFNTVHNAVVVPAPPKPENASAITIGDTIRFKTADGKERRMQVKTLSDIAAAAEQVDPTLNYDTFNSMLESENSGSSVVHFGDKFTVDKSLDIKDLGPSGQ